MGTNKDNLNRPILEDGTDPYHMNHVVGSNYISSNWPKIRADRSASFPDAMLMIDLLLHKYEATYYPNDQDKNLLCMPYMFREPDQGTLLRNKNTNEVYIITDTIKNPATNMWEGLIRIDAKQPPDKDMAEKLEILDEKARVRFMAEAPRSLDTENQTGDELIMDSGPIRPTIAYALLRKEPGSIGKQPFSPQKELKPRLRERLKPDRNFAGQTYEIFGQRFDILAEFGCFATDNRSADLLVDWFEEFMRQYTWVLKLNGVQEVLYWQRTRDTTVAKWRQDLISRSVQYFFRIEELLPEVRKDMIKFDTSIDLKSEIAEAGHKWVAGQLVTGNISQKEYDNLFTNQSGQYLFGDLNLNDNNLY